MIEGFNKNRNLLINYSACLWTRRKQGLRDGSKHWMGRIQTQHKLIQSKIASALVVLDETILLIIAHRYWKGIAQSRSRTDDLRITNALLYQLSYLGF